MAQLAAGSSAALGPLYDRYGSVAYGLAHHMLHDAGAAEDVVQEAFVNIWRSARTFDQQRGNVRGWLLTTVRHCCLDVLRGHAPQTTRNVSIDQAADLPASDDVLSAVLKDIDARSVQQALAALSDDQRETVRLAYFVGLTHVQIAAQQQAPLGTVKGRLRLAMQRLRDLLAYSGATEGGASS